MEMLLSKEIRPLASMGIAGNLHSVLIELVGNTRRRG